MEVLSGVALKLQIKMEAKVYFHADLYAVAVLDTFYWGGQGGAVFNQRGT